MVDTVSATGTVESTSTASATFGTAGTVTEIDVAAGDTVRQGQVLAVERGGDAHVRPLQGSGWSSNPNLEINHVVVGAGGCGLAAA